MTKLSSLSEPKSFDFSSGKFCFHSDEVMKLFTMTLAILKNSRQNAQQLECGLRLEFYRSSIFIVSRILTREINSVLFRFKMAELQFRLVTESHEQIDVIYRTPDHDLSLLPVQVLCAVPTVYEYFEQHIVRSQMTEVRFRSLEEVAGAKDDAIRMFDHGFPRFFGRLGQVASNKSQG